MLTDRSAPHLLLLSYWQQPDRVLNYTRLINPLFL